MIKCEECLTLPICITKIKVEQVESFSYGYSLNIYIKPSCDYLSNCITVPHGLFHDIKRFFLIKKGLINEKYPSL